LKERKRNIWQHILHQNHFKRLYIP